MLKTNGSQESHNGTPALLLSVVHIVSRLGLRILQPVVPRSSGLPPNLGYGSFKVNELDPYLPEERLCLKHRPKRSAQGFRFGSRT